MDNYEIKKSELKIQVLSSVAGAKGEEGESMYEIAKKNGFEGTEQEFIAQYMNVDARIGYYECDTDSSTAAKTCQGASFILPSIPPYGGSFKVKFLHKNSAANPTLSINQSTPKPLYYNGAIASSTNTWEDGDVLDFYYDGTNFNARSVVEKFATGEKVKNVGIDDEPTAGSKNLVKSGGVQNELALGAVYDVSAKNPTSGPNSDGKWESLSVLLSDASLNTLIPTSVRKGGMSIKYVQSSDNNYVQWRLVSKDWSTDTDNWVAENEDFRNKVMQDVNEAIASIAPIEITGDVTNAPDEEDLTSVSVGGTDVLKFKDKAYSPLTYSGLGRVYLRKNIINGVNVLTQDMMPIAETEGEDDPGMNTIYHIQYDYDLNGAEITVPEGCVLEFDGGSFSNGTLVGQSTGIIADKSKKLFRQNMRFNGTWNIGNIYSDWFTFGADDREILNDIFSMSNNSIIYINEDHIVSDISSNFGHRSIGIKSNTTLFLNGTISMLDSDTNNYRILDIYRAENVRIFGGKVVGNLDTYTGGGGKYNGLNICVRYSKNVFINGIESSKCYGDGIYIQESNEITIDSVILHDAKRQGISVTSNVTNCSVNNFNIYNIADNDTIRACGIDIEPNSDSALVSNIKFSNGKIYDCERGVQVLNSFATTIKDIHFYSVEFATQRNEKVIDLQHLNGEDVHFHSCRISSSSIVPTGSVKGVVAINSQSYAVIDFDGCTFDTNTDVLAIRCFFENGVLSFNNCRFICGTVLGINNNNTSFLGCTLSVKNNNPFPVVGTKTKKYLTNCVFLIESVFPTTLDSCVFRSCLFRLSGTIPAGKDFALNINAGRLYDCTIEYNTTTKDFIYLAYLSNTYLDNLNATANSAVTLNYIVNCSMCILGHVTSQNLTYNKIADGTISRMYDQIGFKNFGTTATRPSASDIGAGFTYFDTTGAKPIWSNGTKWIDTKGMTAGVHKGNTEYRGSMPIGTLTEADWYGALDSTPEFNGFKNDVAQTQGDDAGTGTPRAIYFDRIRGKFLFESEDPNISGNYLYWEKWVGSTYTQFVNPAHGTIYKENDNYWKYIAPKTNATLKLDPATDIGYEYFDTDLGKMVYAKSIAADGTASWVDANGMSC